MGKARYDYFLPLLHLILFDSAIIRYTTAQFIWRDLNGKTRSSVKPPNIKMTKKEKKEVQNSQGNS